MLGLSKDLGLKLLLSFHQYYEPSTNANNNYLGTGTNIYNGCGINYSACEAPANYGKDRHNIDQLLDYACSSSNVSDALMGIQITEEASSCHYYNSHDCVGLTGWDGLPGCWEANHSCDEICSCGQASGDFHNVILPVSNVLSAQHHFKDLFSSYPNKKITLKKVSIMEAHHHHAISDDAWTQEGARPADYIKLLSKEDTRDLFLEGSYYSFPLDWASQTQIAPPQPPNPFIGPDNSLCYNSYLAFLKSIDYSKSFANEVHKVIDATGRDQGNNFDPRHFHSNPNVPNANWLWFQAYASIIHGATGVWFWSHPWTFMPSESQKWDAWHTANPIGNPYARSGFPSMYNNYTGPLAQELRYLSNNGFLSKTSQILSNGDKGDIHGIISEYKFVFNIQSENGSFYTHVSDFPQNWVEGYRPLNQFGVKYSFQSNGEEVILIVANPVNSPVQVFFDLKCVGDCRISESNSFEILFSNQVGAKATWSSYKTTRKDAVDLTSNAVLRNCTIGLDNLGELGNAWAYGCRRTKVEQNHSRSLPQERMAPRMDK